MSLVKVDSVEIRPERTRTYEALVHRVAEAAQKRKDPAEWAAHQVTAGPRGRYHFVMEAPDWATLGSREQVPELVGRLLGESEGASVFEKIEECETAAATTICRLRADLSRLPAQGAAPRLFTSVTLFEARAGGQDAVEELFRKSAQALEKLGESRRFLAYQTVVGNLRQYYTVMPVDGLGELDGRLPSQLLQDAFGAEGALVYRNGIEAIVRSEREISRVRPELSNAPWVPDLSVRIAAATKARAATAGAPAGSGRQ